MPKMSDAMSQAGSWEGGWKQPEQMKDPVTPEAKESFGKMSNVKDLKNTAMGGVMGLHKNRPDEGFMRAAMAASEFNKYFPKTTSHRIGGSHPPGYLPMTPVQASSYSRNSLEKLPKIPDFMQAIWV
ncbi:unnamed protein product [Effrenium voratum]|nr:unnamed protein product [Effrenium voratum]